MGAKRAISGEQLVEEAGKRFNWFEPARYFEDPEALLEKAKSDADRIEAFDRDGDWQAARQASVHLADEGRYLIHRLLRGQTALDEVASAAGDIETYLSLNDELDAALDFEDLRYDSRLTYYPDLLDQQRDMAIWYVVEGYNNFLRTTLYAMAEEIEPVEHPPPVRETIEDQIDAIRSDTLDSLRRLYGALAAADWERLEGHAWRSVSYPFEALVDLHGLATRLRAGRRFEVEDGHEGQAAQLASGELEVHRTARYLCLLLAAGYRHVFLARGGDTSEAAREAAEAAAEKSFESFVRDGLNVEIADLVEAPGEYDGRFVEVEGYAEAVRQSDEEGGYGTKFELVDRLHDRRVRVYYPYHDLSAWHLHDGAYVRVEAEFDAESEWVDGPELVVDEVNVGEHGADSWLDGLTSDLAETGIFELYPAHGNVLWSHEPKRHHHGERGGED